LRSLGVRFTILTLDPDGAAEAEDDGLDVVVGDYAKPAVLHEVNVVGARALVVADDGDERTERVAGLVRSLNPTAAVIVRPLGEPDVVELAEAGADHVVTPERASSIGLAIALRDALGAGQGMRPLSTVVRFTPAPATSCRHVEVVEPVLPSAYGCEDCLRMGTTWVHLRICLSCGYVGCCDTSPQRHARAHADEVGHPIIASHEPGEDWAYCFLDDETIEPATSPTA
jgi:monovalent cation:H+ antiporter-2, CPA2 family